MDKHEKCRRRTEWKSDQRAAARDDLPFPDVVLEAYFDFLDGALGRQACDHSRVLTERWLDEAQHPREKMLAWLDWTSGFCDCGVLANSEGVWRDATGRA